MPFCHFLIGILISLGLEGIEKEEDRQKIRDINNMSGPNDSILMWFPPQALNQVEWVPPLERMFSSIYLPGKTCFGINSTNRNNLPGENWFDALQDIRRGTRMYGEPLPIETDEKVVGDCVVMLAEVVAREFGDEFGEFTCRAGCKCKCYKCRHAIPPDPCHRSMAFCLFLSSLL